jgi:hypothetical protein
MCDMEPALSQIDNVVGLSLQRLHSVVSYPLSGRLLSVSDLNDYLHNALCCRRPLGEDTFKELAEFVAAQRS